MVDMKLIITNRQFIVSTRQGTRGNKSATFLIEVLPDGSRQYISSLWPISADSYALEFKGTRYVLNTAKGVFTRQGIPAELPRVKQPTYPLPPV
jgi:hypothetical protein